MAGFEVSTEGSSTLDLPEQAGIERIGRFTRSSVPSRF
jgi:hypothetical protein